MPMERPATFEYAVPGVFHDHNDFIWQSGSPKVYERPYEPFLNMLSAHFPSHVGEEHRFECPTPWWPDVDLDAGKITVRHTLQRVKQSGENTSHLVLLPPKSEKSRRTIDLPSTCVAALKAYKERQPQERALAGRRWRETGHVFTSTIGTPIDDRKILKEFKAVVDAAKLPKQRFHDLRHACISLLGAQGVPAKVIADSPRTFTATFTAKLRAPRP